MFYEEYHGRTVDVAYFGPRSSKTPEQWAEHFGRKVIHGLIEGEITPEVIGGYARLAGSFARMHLDGQVEAAHQVVVGEGFEVIRGAFGGAR